MSFIRWSFLVVSMLALGCPTEQGPPPPGEFLAGAARVVLPAPLGIGTAGDAPFGFDSLNSPYARLFPGTNIIHGHPSAKAVVLSRGDGYEVVFMRLDSIAVPQQLRDAVVAEVLARTGHDLDDALIIGATHSHSAPGRFIDNRILQAIVDIFDANWFQRLVSALADAIEEAYADLAPAELGHAMAFTTEAQSDRRCEDGEDYTNGTMPVVYVSRGGVPFAVVLSYAAHATALGSADYTLSAQQHGAVEEKIEASFDSPVTALYLSSWGGDAASASPSVPGENLSPKAGAYDKFEVIAVHMTEVALAAIDTIVTTAEPSILAGTTRYPINLATLDYALGEFAYPNGGVYCNSDPDCDVAPQRQEGLTVGCTAFPDESPAPMQTMHTVGRVGDLHFFSWPGESGTRLAEGSVARVQVHEGVDDVMFIGYGNDYLGYQLEEDDWWSGGYEASGAMWGPKQGEYMRARLEEIFAAWVATVAGEEATLSFVEPSPAVLFDGDGADEPTVPEEALGVGTVLQEPDAAPARDAVVEFTVAGSEPWVGRPLAHLQRGDGASFEDVQWRGGRAVDSDSYAFWVTLNPEPSYRDVHPPVAREFQWTFSLPITRREPGFELPAGEYRFRVEIPEPGGSVTEVLSAPFTLGG
jgi:hypothetical protein